MDVSPNRHAAAECYHWAMIKQPDPTKRNEVFYFHLLGWRQIQPETAGRIVLEHKQWSTNTCRFVHPEIYTAAERTKPTPLINRRPSKQEQDTAVCHAIQQEQQLWPNKAHNAGSLDFPHQFCLSGELLRILHIQCKCVLL
ncbi:hypothetical protein WJX79_010956 [Trebouxia sp. C0005]